MATFRYLRQHIQGGYWRGPSISRPPEIKEKYKDHLSWVRETYLSTADHIKIQYFNYEPRSNNNNFIYGVPTCRSLCTDLGILTRNLFPYDISDDLTQYVFWSTQPREFQTNHENYVWFVNTKENRSIDDLWHAHLFFRKNK